MKEEKKKPHQVPHRISKEMFSSGLKEYRLDSMAVLASRPGSHRGSLLLSPKQI